MEALSRGRTAFRCTRASATPPDQDHPFDHASCRHRGPRSSGTLLGWRMSKLRFHAVACLNHRVVALPEAVEELRAGANASPSVTVTFDDGYRDNLEIALPILEKYSLPKPSPNTINWLDSAAHGSSHNCRSRPLIDSLQLTYSPNGLRSAGNMQSEVASFVSIARQVLGRQPAASITLQAKRPLLSLPHAV